MYFEKTNFTLWNYQDAFLEYYLRHDYNFQRASDSLKKDLERFADNPNVLKAAAKKVQQYLDHWKSHAKDFKSFVAHFPVRENSLLTTVHGGQHFTNMYNNAGSINYYNEAEGSNSRKRRLTYQDQNQDEIDALFNPEANPIQLDVDQDDEDEDPPLYFVERGLKQREEEDGWEDEEDGVRKVIIGNSDIGAKFDQFVKFAVHKARSTGLFMESHSHSILALSSILLLKEHQHPDDLLRFFKMEELDKITASVKVGAVPNYESLEFPEKTFVQMKRYIKSLLNKTMNRDDVVSALYSLKDEVTYLEFTIIKALINCVTKLPPVKITDDIGEIDLCVSYIDPVISPIFTDFTNNIMLRWPNLKSKESEGKANATINKQRRPDAVVSTIHQHHFNIDKVFGEVKTDRRKEDKYELVRDMVRVGIFCKECIDADNTKCAMGFQAVGANVSFYLVSLLGKKIYTMAEVAKIVIPMSLSELPAFLSQLDVLVQIKHLFTFLTTQAETIDESWKASTLNSPDFKVYIHTSKQAKRPSSLVF